MTYRGSGRLGVSIQLVSPARGELYEALKCYTKPAVSIQLVSPARGELPAQLAEREKEYLKESFHSIGFPCERGVFSVPADSTSVERLSFHSIGFPCERGVNYLKKLIEEACEVSIQLVSPARGEL